MKNITKTVMAVSVLAMVVDVLVFRGGDALRCMIADLMFLSALMLALPEGADGSMTIRLLTLASTVVFLSVSALAVLWKKGGSPSQKYFFIPLLSSASLVIVSVIRIRSRCRDIMNGHTSATGWRGEILAETWLVLVMLFISLTFITVSLWYCQPHQGTAALISLLCVWATFASIPAFRFVSGGSFFFRNDADSVDDDTMERSSGMPEPAPDDKNQKMFALYKRIVEYMETNEPYLDDSLDLESLSRSLFTNKVYMSRTVNSYSGRNFRQFVNSYRVDYAIRLMQKDPHLRIEEVALMSGFHTAVSFNMAFHLFKGENPSEWLRRYRMTLK